jgi:4-alpha-glucanotransferase
MLERGRQAGVLVPLFSMASTRSWGIGELLDLAAFAPWLERAGLSFLQLLPLNEVPAGRQSPYAAMSAMALDPIFLSVEAMDDFLALGGPAQAAASVRHRIARARAAARIDYATVRRLKMEALRAAFDHFYQAAWRVGAPRATQLHDYIAAEAWWLEDYALYRALQDRTGSGSWMAWPAALRERRPAALAQARSELARDILFYQYLQWQAAQQWRTARAAAGVAVVGDLPFMVSADSVDVWVRQDEFDLGASVGTPPDAFSPAGQQWGVPPYRWELVRRRDFAWLRARAARAAALYDACRIDHVVGFYRTYVRPLDGSAARFDPGTEAEQAALGEQVLAVLQSAGIDLIAEDLGTVPDFVRASLGRLGIPGYRVFRWEREWQRPGRPYRDPTTYPALSVATTATHDMTPTAVWWDELSADERAAVGAIPSFRSPEGEIRWAPFSPALRDALLDLLMGAGSRVVVFPIQDVFGWRDRINVPATERPENWTYRLPWPVDRWLEEPDSSERALALRRGIERHDRLPAGRAAP